MTDAPAIRAELRLRWPAAFRDGFRIGAGDRPASQREPGNYPLGFHGWPLDRRNAWFCAWNAARCKRKRDEARS